MDSDEIEATNLLARRVLEDMRPSELPLFEPTQAAFWANGGRLPDARSNDGIGFGNTAQIAVALGPIALAVGVFALEVLRDLAKDAAKAAGKSLFAEVKERLGGCNPLQLPPAAFAQLQAGIAEEAGRYLSKDHAAALTHAIVARLAAPEPLSGPAP